jgi:hypothetical protein
MEEDMQRSTVKVICITALILAVAGLTACAIGNKSGTCKPGKQCVCDGIGNCTYTCPQGDCNFVCTGIGNCILSCEGGGCNAACSGTGNCNLSCEGGGCNQICSSGAGNCILSDCPSGCDLDCLNIGTCVCDEGC